MAVPMPNSARLMKVKKLPKVEAIPINSSPKLSKNIFRATNWEAMNRTWKNSPTLAFLIVLAKRDMGLFL